MDSEKYPQFQAGAHMRVNLLVVFLVKYGTADSFRSLSLDLPPPTLHLTLWAAAVQAVPLRNPCLMASASVAPRSPWKS